MELNNISKTNKCLLYSIFIIVINLRPTFQIYIPLTLIVCCSWVTFWLVKTEKGGEIPARTSLGATTVLSVVTIGFGGKSKPQVNAISRRINVTFLCIATLLSTATRGISLICYLYLQVGYATALDVFIMMCFAIVFAALVEFACINFIDTLIRRIKRKEREKKRLKASIKFVGWSIIQVNMQSRKYSWMKLSILS